MKGIENEFLNALEMWDDLIKFCREQEDELRMAPMPDEFSTDECWAKTLGIVEGRMGIYRIRKYVETLREAEFKKDGGSEEGMEA